jgi:hypothetical protein
MKYIVILITGDNELEKIKFAAEEREKFHSDEKARVLNVIQEKGEI